MPLADGVSVCGLRYLDAAGTAFAVPPAGLGAADRARIRALALDLTLVPTALHGPTARTVLVALRSGE